MNNNKFKQIATLMLGGTLMLGSIGCTESFEDFNTNPKAPTPEQMEGDFVSTATLISTMIPVMVQGQENNYQMIDQMIGCEYGRMTCARNHWSSDAYFATYNPSEGWGEIPFTTSMPQIYTPFFQIRDISGGEGLVYHWANLIRIFGTLRVSDCYGPVPFSKIGLGSNYQVAYDDMETLFNSMLEELDAAIPVLKESGFASVFADVDYIYGGDMTKWVKFANTLKLRLALRLVNVNPTLAQQKAEEAANDAVGLISEPADAAWSSFIPGGNSLHKINISWNEGAVSADILSYMNGYEDPRMAKYATANADGNYLGMRSGLWHRDAGNGFDKFSKPVVTEQDKLLCISASESWFSRAEGALRGWNMGGTAQYFYEKGIEVSMSERGAAIGSYLTSEAVPADYEDPNDASNNITAVSTVTPKWIEGNFETNLEQIMVQKWIGNFPNGWETWADVRRTGYPKFFPTVENRSTAGVSSQRGMRRLPFPVSEFNTNEANVKAAQQLLGGPDTGATDLWWAKKN